MKKLILLLLLISPFMALADCLDSAQTGDGTAVIDWNPAPDRTDGSAFLPADNTGYMVYYTDMTDGSNCSRMIPDKNVTTSTFVIHKDRAYEFVVVQLDALSNGSAPSEIINRQDNTELPFINNPAPVTDLVITRVDEKLLDYSFNFSPVTTFSDGVDLPDGAVTKYYLFFNDAWQTDIQPDAVPFVLTLNEGTYVVEIETEILVNGQKLVSERSVAQTINAKAYVSPPNPPIIVDVPAGATTMTISFETK